MRLNSLRTNSHYNLEIVYKLNMSRIWFSGLFIQNIFTILLTYTNLFTNVLVFCSCTKYINQIQISFENVFCTSLGICIFVHFCIILSLGHVSYVQHRFELSGSWCMFLLSVYLQVEFCSGRHQGQWIVRNKILNIFRPHTSH